MCPLCCLTSVFAAKLRVQQLSIKKIIARLCFIGTYMIYLMEPHKKKMIFKGYRCWPTVYNSIVVLDFGVPPKLNIGGGA